MTIEELVGAGIYELQQQTGMSFEQLCEMENPTGREDINFVFEFVEYIIEEHLAEALLSDNKYIRRTAEQIMAKAKNPKDE